MLFNLADSIQGLKIEVRQIHPGNKMQFPISGGNYILKEFTWGDEGTHYCLEYLEWD